MKKEILLTSSLLCCSFLSAQDNRPNIVLFLVDDMGWQDTSLPFWNEKTPFNEEFHTPNMERLAKEGRMMTSAYACSVSSPSRASLFTGMNASRHRVTNWTLHRNQEVDSPHPLLGYPAWNVNGIQPTDSIERSTHCLSLAQILKDNGYYTIHCGKAHFGSFNTPAADPTTLGFDVNIAGHACGGPGSYLGEENYGNVMKNGKMNIWGIPGLEKYHGSHTFLTEALTIEALDRVEKRDKDKPFFLYMSQYAVHVPIKKDDRFYQKYIDRGYGEKDAAYAALVEGMDKSLGDIMDYLEEKNLEKNTIVIFMSDNGGISIPGVRDGKPHMHNAPLKSGKGSANEGGIREPMIVKWPGKVKPNTKCDNYLIIEDFFPTILEMAQIKMPKTPQTIDGVSFIPLLTDITRRPAQTRSIYWNFPNNWGPSGPGIGATCTIRKGDWKLIYYYENGFKELYNIREDIGEKKNLAGQEPELTMSLSKELGEYLRSVDAQRPFFKATGEPCLWPDESVKEEVEISDRIQSVDDENIFRDPVYHNWCSSIIKGEDGKYHLIYSRWKRKYTFYAWLTHSTIAHAVSDTPYGPFKYVNTLLDFEQKNHQAGDLIMAHNPKIRFFNGKYYLYFISTHIDKDISNKELIKTADTGYSHANWGPLRKNQRVYIASAASINGPFEVNKEPLIEPTGPITTLTTNPAITQGHDGKYYLIIKGDKPGSTKFERNQVVAISDYPDKGFVIQDKPVIQDWDTEDMSVWYNQHTHMYYSFFHAHTYIGMMASKNGRDWRKACDFKLMEKRIQKKDGTLILPDRMERPFVFVENEEPQCLSVAVKKGDDTFIVFNPIKK